MRLVAGTLLADGERKGTAPAAGRARIVAVDRAAKSITVQGRLPDALEGRRLIIDNHGERLCSYTITAARRLPDGKAVLTLDSTGNIGEGLAAGFGDGFVKNGPEVNMPFAGLVKIGERFDYSDCFYHGGHLENGKPGVDFRVRGVMGFPYQAWANLHIAGINDVALRDKVPAARLREALGEGGRWTIYEYGVGDDAWLDHGAVTMGP